jgi:hypothetical protein
MVTVNFFIRHEEYTLRPISVIHFQNSINSQFFARKPKNGQNSLRKCLNRKIRPFLALLENTENFGKTHIM